MAVPNPTFYTPTKKTTTSPFATEFQPPTSGAAVPKPPTAEQLSAQAWINNPDSGQGGLDAYSKTQNERWQAANAANDSDLMGRLQADSQRVGYTLNPYTPVPKSTTPVPSPTPAATKLTTAAAPNTAAPTQYSDWTAKQNELMAKYEQMMNASFEYDPETDPRYQAYRTLAQNRAKDASQSTMETLNDRGILNSSVTGTQLAQIQQGAEQEALAAVPQFYSEARQAYQDKLRNAAEMLQFAAGRGDQAYDREYQAGRDAVGDERYQQEFDRGVLESDRNYDRGVLESDRDYDRQTGRDAVGDNQWQQSFDRGNLESDRNYQMQQDQVAYQKARDEIADARYQQEFDRDTEQWGLEYALNKAVQMGQLSNQGAQLALSARNAQLDEDRFDYQKEQDLLNQMPKSKSGEDYFSFLDNSKFLSPETATGDDGQLIRTGKTIVNDPAGLERSILSLGLSDAEARKLYYRYGLKWE